MHCQKALLVGCKNQTLAALRNELHKFEFEIEDEVLDVDECLARIATSPCDNRFLIVDATSHAETSQIRRLREAFAGQPMIALADSDLTEAALMRCGACEVARLPLESNEFQAILGRALAQDGRSRSNCRSVVVLGASEGSGCTTLSLNLASELARLQNLPCILGEQAVAFGRLANLLQINPPLTLYDLVTELDRLDAAQMRKALTPIDDNLSVLVGSYLAVRPVTITPEIAFKVLSCTLQLAETVIVDARHNFDEIDFEFAANVQHLVLVGKPTIPSLRCLRTLLEAFAKRDSSGQKYVVINQYQPSDDVSSKDAIERFLDVPRVFLIALDAHAVDAAEKSGQVLRKLYPRSQIVKDITALARALLGLPPEQEPRPSVREWLNMLHALVNGS